jgi:hypothetical protein
MLDIDSNLVRKALKFKMGEVDIGARRVWIGFTGAGRGAFPPIPMICCQQRFMAQSSNSNNVVWGNDSIAGNLTLYYRQ